jgi:hypothetical protein
LVHVLVLCDPGLIEAQARWRGIPSNLALIINGPGKVGYYARRDGSSPLGVSYRATSADLAHGDTWRVSLASFEVANAQGSVGLRYPGGAPCGQIWRHDFRLRDNRVVYYLRLTRPGEIRARATWSGTQSSLALIVNGPGKVNAYARRDGGSPLEVAYNVTRGDFTDGDTWRLTVASFGAGQANGTVQLWYPSGSSLTPFGESFVVKPNYGRVVHVLRLSSPGLVEGRATWSGTPSNLAMLINGPGQVGYYARRDGGSPLSVSYLVTRGDMMAGDLWRLSLTSFHDADASGQIQAFYP